MNVTETFLLIEGHFIGGRVEGRQQGDVCRLRLEPLAVPGLGPFCAMDILYSLEQIEDMGRACLAFAERMRQPNVKTADVAAEEEAPDHEQ